MKKILISTVFGLVIMGLAITNAKAQYRTHCFAHLTASDRNARITLRAGPGTQTRSLGYGLVDDFIYLITNSPPELDFAVDRNGYNWYRVEFPKSGAKGWIRGDFLNIQCRHNDQ